MGQPGQPQGSRSPADRGDRAEAREGVIQRSPKGPQVPDAPAAAPAPAGDRSGPGERARADRADPPRAPGRLRLRRLQLRDFRGLAELELDLSYLGGAPLDVAVLRGGAGAGKTAALEAVLLLLELHDLLGAGAPLAEPRLQVRWGRPACELVAELELVHALPERTLRRRAEASLRIDGAALSMWTLPTTQRRFLDQAPQDPPGREHSDGAAADLTLPWPPRGRIAYIPASRGEPDLLPLVRLLHRSQRLVEAGGDRGPLPQVRALQKLWQHLAGTGELRLLRRDEGGDEVLVVCDGELPPDVTSLAQAGRLAARRALPRVLPIERTSHAERAGLALAAALCARDTPPDLVLLDEPERHLPPDWQARLLPALRQAVPQAQLVVASHAEPIAASVLAYERLPLLARPSTGAAPDRDNRIR
jgi:hypothetical protein